MRKICICLLLLSAASIASAQFALTDNRIHGGNSLDEARKFALSQNNVVHFFGGRSFSTDGDLPDNFGGIDFWIMKRSADGTPLWSRNYGGSTNDELVTILPHSDGGVLGFGTTRTDQGLFGTINGLAGAWIMRTDPNGNLIDGHIFGGPITELAADAYRFATGSLGLAIESTSPMLDGQPNNGAEDVWIVNTTQSLQLSWSVLIGGEGSDIPRAVDGDVSSNLYVAATTTSDLPDVQPNQGEEDVWMFKLSPSGDLLWQVTLGGSAEDLVTDIRYHPDGYVFAVVQSQSADGDFAVNRGLNDLWIVKLDAENGDVLGTYSYGGSGNDFDGHLDFYGEDGLILIASTSSQDIDLSGNKGLVDVWVAGISLDGALLQQMNYGGSGNDLAADVIVEDSLIHIISTSTSSDQNVVPNSLAQPDLWYFTLDTHPDSCSVNFVCQSDTTTTNELFPPAEDVLLCVSGCTAGYGPGPQNAVFPCGDFDASTAYFRVTTDTTADLLTLSVTSSEFNQPQLALLRSVNCVTFQLIECAVGENGEVFLPYVEIDPLSTYVVAISDAEGNIGQFELCATSVDVDFCNLQDEIYATATSLGSPLSGPYQPGEEVRICYELTDWNKLDCNGFQGLMPTFGPGWDSTNFDLKGQPIQMDTLLMPVEEGYWAWYGVGEVRYNIGNPVNGYGSSQGLPGGWYFTNTSDPPPTDGPDQTTGDIYSCLPTPDTWKVCFTLKVVEDCTENLDCSITMKTFADGEIGINPGLACVYDQEEIFTAFMRCCLNPNIENIQDFNLCSGDTLTLLPETNLLPPVTYSWTSVSDPLIEGATNGNSEGLFRQSLTTAAAVPLGVDYLIWASGNGCVTDTESFRITVLPPPSGQISSTGAISVCAGGTVTLNFECEGTPPFVIGVYRDNQPFIEVLSESGFSSVEIDPVFSSRLRIGEIRDANCAGNGTGFVDVIVRPTPSFTLDTLICEAGFVEVGDSTFTESGNYVITLEGGGSNNCDSIVFLNLTVVPSLTEEISEVICRGDTLWVLDQPYTETTNEVIEYSGPEGCPNFIELDLLVRDTFTFEVDQTICFGDTILFGGVKIYQEGSYASVEEVRPMCFEQTILHLDVLPQIYINDLAIMADNGAGTGAILVEILGGTSGLSYLWNTGQTTESLFNLSFGTYSLTVTDSRGCQQTFAFTVPLANSTSEPDALTHVLQARPTILKPGGSVEVINQSLETLNIRDITWWTTSGMRIPANAARVLDGGASLWLNLPAELPSGITVLRIVLTDGQNWHTRLVTTE